MGDTDQGRQTAAAASALGDLTGKIRVDCNNALRWEAGPVWDPPPEGSLAAVLAAVLESLAVLWIHLATAGGHGREVGFKLLGRE